MRKVEGVRVMKDKDLKVEEIETSHMLGRWNWERSGEREVGFCTFFTKRQNNTKVEWVFIISGKELNGRGIPSCVINMNLKKK